MIIIMKMQATDPETDAVITRVTKEGFKTHVSVGEERTIIGIIGDERLLDQGAISRMKGVDRVVPVLRPFKLASRDFKEENTVVTINGHQVGGNKVIVMAGPCSVESLDQMMETAIAVREAGAHLLRGGAFKPRTSPYSFQGMGEEGLKIMAQVREETGLTCGRLYSADICEQFYEADRDAISMLPVFVGFVDADAAVMINHEHSEFRWVSFAAALAMVPFAGQRHVLKHVEAEFAQREPVRHLLIEAASPKA